MEKINALGEPTILQINGSIKLNGSEVPSVNILDGAPKDLIILKSKNPVEIYHTLLEYFYQKTIGQDDDKLSKLHRLIEVKIDNYKFQFKDESKAKYSLNKEQVIYAFMHDPILNDILEKVRPNGLYKSSRQEVYAAIKSLTREFTGQKIRPQLKYVDYDPTSPDLEDHVVESMKPHTDSTPYPERTKENANWADFTIALAENFGSTGERLTRRAAGDRYVSADLLGDVNTTVDSLYSQMLAKGIPDEVKLNIAGNAISSKLHFTQAQSDAFVLAVLSGLQEKLKSAGKKIAEVRSGGQSGVDESGTKAAIALGLPWSIVAPERFLYRDLSGDHIGIENFMRRFNPDYYDAENTYTFAVDGVGNVVETVVAKKQNARFKIKDKLMEYRQKMRQQPKADSEALMTMWYGDNANDRIKKHMKYKNRKHMSTIMAIIEGFRTSTTRNATMKGYNSGKDRWDQKQPGEIIMFRNWKKGEKEPEVKYEVYCEITDVITWTKEMLKDKALIQEWSDAEGWSTKYFEEQIKPKIEQGIEVKQFKYEVVDIRYDKQHRKDEKDAMDLAEKIRKGKSNSSEIWEFIQGNCGA